MLMILSLGNLFPVFVAPLIVVETLDVVPKVPSVNKKVTAKRLQNSISQGLNRHPFTHSPRLSLLHL